MKLVLMFLRIFQSVTAIFAFAIHAKLVGNCINTLPNRKENSFCTVTQSLLDTK